MANINKHGILTSDQEQMLLVQNEFDEAVRVDTRNRERSYHNWRAYFAVDGGQYDYKSLEKLNDEDRHASQFNIIQPKVDTLAGALSSEKFDVDYKPIEGDRNSLTEAVLGSWYSDKDLCHYDKQIANCIKNGLVYRGDLKMIMSDRYNPLRNIAFKEVMPGYLLRDPYWDTDDDRDCEKAWEVYYLNALQIKQQFDAKGPQIDQEIQLLGTRGGNYRDYGYNYNEFTQHMIRGIKGHLFRIIEYHWMETIKTTRISGQKLGTTRYINFPLTNDDEARERFMVQNDIDPATMIDTPYNDKIHHVEIICPELKNTGMLISGVSKVQPKRLPYFHFSANRVFGQDKGIVDDLLDLQRTINKRELKLTNLIAAAGGGGKLASDEVWSTPEEKEELRQNASNPDYVKFGDPDDLKGAVEYINQNQFHSDIVNQIERMYDVVDRISKVPAAMDAMSESASESGVLFDRKLQVSRMGLITLLSRLQEFRKNIHEAYYEQWQLSYNGPEREMSSYDNKYNVVLNKRVFNAAEGKIYIQNRPAMIPRCNVIVTESPSSPTRKMRDRALYSEMFDRAVQTNPETASIFFRGLMKTMDLDDDEQAELDALNALQKMRDRKRIMTELETLDATEKQAVLAKVQAIMGIEQITGGGKPQPMEQVQIPESEIPQQGEPILETPQQEQQGQELLLTS